MDVINTIGRRKAAVARIYMKEGSGKILVNNRESAEYFPVATLQNKIIKPFELTDTVGRFDVKVNVAGGGITGQAEAVQLAISRALVELNGENRPTLKPEKMLTRDPRMVERKKFGQKKARKKFQFSKR